MDERTQRKRHGHFPPKDSHFWLAFLAYLHSSFASLNSKNKTISLLASIRLRPPQWRIGSTKPTTMASPVDGCEPPLHVHRRLFCLVGFCCHVNALKVQCLIGEIPKS